MRCIIFCFFALGLAFAKPSHIMVLQNSGVDVTISGERVRITREIPRECLDLKPTIATALGGNLADESIAPSCKKNVATTIGTVQAMKLHPKVETVGELETLDFIKNKLAQFPEKYLLVDSRRPEWVETGTIPGASNIPFNEIFYDSEFPNDFERLLNLTNIKKEGNGYNFDAAKTLLIFCNGSWCTQSAIAIESLIQLGYPPEKLLWFRGGLQDWRLLNFTTTPDLAKSAK